VFRLARITKHLLAATFIASGAVHAGGLSPADQTKGAGPKFNLDTYLAAPALGRSVPRSWLAAGATSGIGENIFRAKCAVCHGIDGSGRTPNGKKLRVPDLRSERVQNHLDDEWLDVVTNGKGNMPPFGKKYSADKIQQVVAYVRSLGRRN
jgi:cytochrome c6